MRIKPKTKETTVNKLTCFIINESDHIYIAPSGVHKERVQVKKKNFREIFQL